MIATHHSDLKGIELSPLEDDVPLLNDHISNVNSNVLNEHHIPTEWVATYRRRILYNNVDQFIADFYTYFQHKGFYPIMTSGILSLVYICVISSATLISFHCLNYNSTSIELKPASQCLSEISPLSWVLFSLCLLFVFWNALDLFGVLRRMNDMRWIFEEKLGIPEKSLPSYSWSQLTPLLNSAQEHINFGVDCEKLTNLNVRQRLLRFTNYEIALFSQNVIFPVFHVPLIGPVVYYPELLSNYIHLALLKAPNCIFNSDNTLTDIIKLHPEVGSVMLKKHLFIMSVIGFLLSPFICLYKLLDNFYKHTEVIRQNPRLFSKRVWTKYGRIVLRHFNELDHELDSRLYDNYSLANDYLDSYVSYTCCAIFRFVASISGCFAAILFLRSVICNRLSNQLILPITVLGLIYKLFIGYLPNEDHQKNRPNILLRTLQNNVRFLKRPLTNHCGHHQIRKMTSFLLTHRMMYILTEITSPVIAPFILLLYIQPNAKQIVDFFRSHTLSTTHFGDICTFSVDHEPKENGQTNILVTDDSYYKMQQSFRFINNSSRLDQSTETINDK